MVIISKNSILPIILILNLLIQPPAFTQGQSDSDQLDPFFEVTILLIDSERYLDKERLALAEELISDFTKIGINLTLEFVPTLFDWSPRVVEHDKIPYPISANGGYDITMIQNQLLTPDMGSWIVGNGANRVYPDRGAETGENPLGDYAGYVDQKFLSLRNQYLSETNPDESLGAREEIQRHLFEELPIIGLFNPQNLVLSNPSVNPTKLDLIRLQRGTFLSGWENLVNRTFNPIKDSLTIGYEITRDQFFGDPLLLAFPYNTQSYWGAGKLIPSLIFQSLYQRDPNDYQNFIPLLASQLPIWDDNTATIKIHKNITFSDGTPLTSLDVVNSYRSWTNPPNWVADKFAYIEAQKFNELLSTNDIQVLDNHTIQFEFSDFFVDRMRMLSLPIFPEHLYGSYENQTIQSFSSMGGFEFLLHVSDHLNTQTETNFLIGSGPYRFANNLSIPEKLVFTLNPSYWGDTNGMLDQINIKLMYNETSSPSSQIEFLANNAIDLLMPMTRDTIASFNSSNTFNNVIDTAKSLGLRTTLIDSFSTQNLLINMAHPIIGSGLGTPKGSKNGSLAENAAINVRYAMSHTINREQYKSSIYGGAAIPQLLPISRLNQAYNSSYQTHPFDLNIAKDHMRAAGYLYPGDPENPENTEDPESSTSVGGSVLEELSNPIVFALVAVTIGGTIGSGFGIRRYRQRLRRYEKSDEVVSEYLKKVKKFKEAD
jgi:ABC-type transport system substrate-binding protein